MAFCLEGNSRGQVDQTIHRNTNPAAILGYCDNSICRAVEVFAHTARELIFDACSERFADIHLPSGDLYAHEGASLVQTTALSRPSPPPKAPRCHAFKV